MEPLHSFGAWVRRRRKALDLTQQNLAAQVGCAAITIRKIEADDFRPSRQVAERLAVCLDLPGSERELFLQVARAERTVDQLELPTPSPRPASPGSPGRAGLPAQLTSFIGRTNELATLSSWCATQRLVTLIGTGGTGKTRLALQVAGAVADVFANGVCLVELAPVQQPTLVLQTIADALGLRSTASDLRAALIDALRSSQLLLVLDNCEHVLAACAELAFGLLTQCPQLHILATSRAPLNLLGEQIYPVEPLATPPTEQLPLNDLRTIESVRLFAARAQAVNPAFALTNENALAVATICRRLDGLPLAIELAAAQSRYLTPQRMAARLNEPLSLLARGPSNLPPRQQTLRATIAWSYDLLSPDEQRVFRHIALFAGGCTIDAISNLMSHYDADAGMGDEGWGSHASYARGWQSGATHQAPDISAAVESLLYKSMLTQTNAHDEPRLTLLETLRTYAYDQLVANGEAPAAHRHVAHYYRALVESAGAQSDGPHEQETIALLNSEHDNLRAVLVWALDTSQPAPVLAAGLCCQLWRYWRIRGLLEEGWRWISRTLDHHAALTAPIHADLLYGAAVLARVRNDIDRTEQLHDQALMCYTQLGDRTGMARTLNSLGVLRFNQSNYAMAQHFFQESLALHQQMGNQYSVAITLNNLANIAFKHGNLDQAMVQYQHALELLTGPYANQRSIALISANLAEIARKRRNYPQALLLLQRSAALYRTLANDEGLIFCISNLVEIALDTQQYRLATRLLDANNQLYSAIGAVRSQEELLDYYRQIEYIQRYIAYHPVDTTGRSTQHPDQLETLLTDTFDILINRS